MIARRSFLKASVASSVAALGGLGAFTSLLGACGNDARRQAGGSTVKSETRPEFLYDVHAQALYMDGTLGPKTGIITADAMLAGTPLAMTFWHGHGGVDHHYEVTATQLAELRAGKRVYVETDIVEDHAHKLFIDPVETPWRVAGAEPKPNIPAEDDVPPVDPA